MTKTVCPHCRVILDPPSYVAVGQQMECPRCHGWTAVQASIPVGTLESPRSSSSKSSPALAPPSTRSVQVAAPFAPPPTRRSVLPVATIAGLMLLLVGAAGVAWFFFADDASALPIEQQVKANTEGPLKNSPEPKLAVPATPALVASPPPPAKIEVKPSAAEPPPTPAPAAPAPKPEAVVKLVPPAKLTPLEPPLEKKPAAARLLPKEEQKKVDAAIERGVRFLKAQQLRTGTWRPDGFHALGYAALPALTLLECNVPAKDPVVQRAASVVRRHAHLVNDTYDLALALLFLDRLGDKSDRALIQKIGLRLVAAQTEAGGWNYDCPILTKPEMAKLMLFLQQARPPAAQLLSLPAGAASEQKALPGAPSASSLGRSGTQPTKPKSVSKDSPAAKTKPALRLESLPANVRRLPIVNAIAKPKGMEKANARLMPFLPTRDDNSNSQFALLALWAARRHDVPTERTLALADKRYRTSQNADGGWGYQHRSPTKSAMTGVGLLGLALGHGASEEGLRAAAEGRNKAAAARKLLGDAAIHDGLEAFAQYVGGANDRAPLHANLYFLWTVERVAMLYNLPTIGNKDWYRWGVNILVPSQQPAGGWFLGGYPGADIPVDTSFALLFLKRSNLVQDLTRDLTFYLAITDPASSGKRKSQP
jgi:hypothetical protein